MKLRPTPPRWPDHPRCRSGPGNPGPQTAASMIELLCVAAILLILTTLYWGSGSESRQHQRLRVCRHNLEAVFMALQVYANDAHGAFPAVAQTQRSEDPLALLVPRCTIDTSVFLCPAAKDPALPQGEPFGSRSISYAFYMGRRSTDLQEVLLTDRQVNTQPKSAGQLLFSADGHPPGNNHGRVGGNLLFGDGHSDTSPPYASASLLFTQGVALLNP
jgi:hypothetical protein